MPKILHEREKCIGCGSCVAICPKFWEMSEDGKSSLIDGTEGSGGNYEREVTEREIGCNQEAADSCPVQIIKVNK